MNGVKATDGWDAASPTSSYTGSYTGSYEDAHLKTGSPEG